ncbi:P1 family peptidase [Nonomuraea ferruginea]
MKGGVGTASMTLSDGTVVGAIVVVNSAGSPVDPRDCSLFAARYEVAGEFRGLETPKAKECRPEAKADAPSLNTTIAVVATNAPLEKAAAARMASNSQDGLARAISPIHTLGDGDTIFGMSTGTGTPLRVNNPADSRLAQRDLQRRHRHADPGHRPRDAERHVSRHDPELLRPLSVRLQEGEAAAAEQAGRGA